MIAVNVSLASERLIRGKLAALPGRCKGWSATLGTLRPHNYGAGENFLRKSKR
jgi:hypothetical protein